MFKMSGKRKGINAERELIHMFWSNGWSAHRIAGSGSSKYPSPDIIAANTSRRLAIESKVTKEQRKYFSEKDVEQLMNFSQIFGAESWIAVKFGRNDWFFIKAEELIKTTKGYYISLELAKNKGLSFNDLLKA